MKSICKGKASLVVTRTVSGLSLVLSRMNWLAGKRAPKVSRPPRWGTWVRLLAVPALLVLLARGVSLASFSLTFQGLVRTLSTRGSITLSSPAGIVVDSSGNTFVADTGYSRIVEVNAQGTASVLTITGLSQALVSPTGIAIDGSGNLYVTDADACNSRIVKFTPAGAATEISTGSVNLSSPKGVALDQSGDIFIADTGNNRIVEVTIGGSAAALTITVSSGSSTLSSPRGLAVNPAGKLYIADSSNNRIVTVAAGSTTGIVASILGGVTLSGPTAVTVDRIGNVIIADTANNRIAEIDTSSNGTVLFTDSQTLSGPLGVADPFGTAYISDSGNNRALIVAPPVNGGLTTSDPTFSLNKSAVEFGHSQLGTSTPVTILLPFTTGSVGLGAVKVLTFGTQNLDFTSTSNTTCNGSTSASTSCSVEISFLSTAPGLLRGAVVLFDASQNPILTIPLYAWADTPVTALSPNTASVISTGGTATSNPYELALDGAGNMYVGSYTSKSVTKIPAGGGSASVVALGTPGSTAVQNITGVALDGAGNLFIGDHQNSRILVVTPGGVVSVLNTVGLSPALGFRTALAFDAAGNLYIADFTNSRVVEISTLVVAGSTSSGNATVVGTGSFSFSGSTVTGVTVDSTDAIYIAARTQNSSQRVRRGFVWRRPRFRGGIPLLRRYQGKRHRAVDAVRRRLGGATLASLRAPRHRSRLRPHQPAQRHDGLATRPPLGDRRNLSPPPLSSTGTLACANAARTGTYPQASAEASRKLLLSSFPCLKLPPIAKSLRFFLPTERRKWASTKIWRPSPRKNASCNSQNSTKP
jgi:sugar lactone lactonase YvrE